ncbi:MAG: hypothetical protein AAFV54_03475 [Pseudomonadota bacterium]
MNFDDLKTTDTSHFGLPTALPDEMPPGDLDSEVQHGNELGVASLLLPVGLAVVGIILMFVVF